jgi:hypothetical protein
VYRRQRHALAAGGLDVFSAALVPGRSVDLEEQRVREVRRDDVQDGAPPYGPIDLDSGTARVSVRRESATWTSPPLHRGCLPSKASDGGGQR